MHTLEEESEMATDDAKAKLAAALKQLDKTADELHHSAEANDADGTALNLKSSKGCCPWCRASILLEHCNWWRTSHEQEI